MVMGYQTTWTRCHACIVGDCFYPDPVLHSWMDAEDADHWAVTWPLSTADVIRYPCACWCAGNNGPHEEPNR